MDQDQDQVKQLSRFLPILFFAMKFHGTSSANQRFPYDLANSERMHAYMLGVFFALSPTYWSEAGTVS